MQWRPIFYYQMPKVLEESTLTQQYAVGSSRNASIGIGQVFYTNVDDLKAVNVSFGLQGDEKVGYFYSQNNYSTWTFTVGLGAAPTESMSAVVLVIIFVGFGLPAAVIVIGLIAMIVRKVRQNSQQSGFTRLD